MSYLDPVEPDDKLPEDIEQDDVCKVCGGTGITTTDAHQVGGTIVDEHESECLCQVEARAEQEANNEIDR